MNNGESLGKDCMPSELDMDMKLVEWALTEGFWIPDRDRAMAALGRIGRRLGNRTVSGILPPGTDRLSRP